MTNSTVAREPALETVYWQAIQRACATIAPAWPLDRQIAVNPWWELRDVPMKEVSARFAALAGVRCVPMDEEHDGAPPVHWLTVSELIDGLDDNRYRVAWQDELVWQISQFMAEHDASHASPACSADDLYRRWREVASGDIGLSLAMGERNLHKAFGDLPDTVEELFARAIDELAIDGYCLEDVALAALLSVNGWASRLAWLRWEAGLAGKKQDLLPALLAIRLGWELVLWRLYADRYPLMFRALENRWKQQQEHLPRMVRDHGRHQQRAWQRLERAEHAWREPLLDALRSRRQVMDNPAPGTEPVLQVVCCIDVRSERMRRALEAQHPGIRTTGFAGFFGLPLQSMTADGRHGHPHLPGLLAPGLTVVAESSDRKAHGGPVHAAATAAPSMFGAVEAGGLAGAWSLLRTALGRNVSDSARRAASSATRYRLLRDDRPLTAAERADLAGGVLGAMGLTDGFAPTVLLTGHGSSSCNNPQAAALDCGACGGQSGALNVRVLADLLNDAEVRGHMAEHHGIAIPDQTRFVPALHDTTTDRVEVLAGEALSAQQQAWLEAAGDATREERKLRQGIEGDPARRATDASQVRPEWGLAGNAGFIIAPRALTRGMDLDGRCFLNDYDAGADPAGSRLEAILTGPMVVTNWINLQYYASTVDNAQYGSGNKVLHNVVRGNPGVFEGHGGDLRQGLSIQSLYDGDRAMHEPLRLLVVIDAPRERVQAILDRHPALMSLVDNGWVALEFL
ncbi:MAG: DUF2309 domain-containing protein [Pseudohongiellaceae bacterium]